MRVGANVRQYHRIKKMHAEGVSADIIAMSIPLTPQSLEKILAHIDGREEVTLAVEENAEVQALRLEVAQQAARLAKFEDPQDGETTVEIDTDPTPEIEAGEEVQVDEEVEDSKTE
ncbi:hypothetical protein LCGC14_1043700 [marine sediment metagenome]|uniref:Uncharacterized protein n=1 Tax=marine sediment metagenome TaxID=412755 RepID=A0A0F9QX73_9ZZZZ